MEILLFAGIVLVTGLLFGKLAKYAHLPTVTGYLVGGLLIGPSVFGVISEANIGSLGLVSQVALGFIAFSIGNELKLSYFKRVGSRPIVIAVFESLFAVLFVFVGLILFFLIRGDLNVTNIRFALILSAIAAATAPAATLMVIRQYRASGSLTEMLMSVVALDDSVALMLFGINVALANALGGSSGSLFIQILKPIWEIVFSLGIGALFGVTLTLACKWYSNRGNRVSVVIALLFLTIFLTYHFGGSVLLACMALGGVFANLSKDYDEVTKLTAYVTPPIFMMFFVISGAELNVSIIFVVGLIGLVYVLFRVAGKIFGAWFGSKITHAEPKIAKYLGYTLIPQAGVAIGLSLIATQILNVEMGSQIRTIVLAATLIYELAGPIITKITLKKAKEINLSENY
ncbi:MAG: cation:proton antiporter [Bacilli bacterium]|jgi:Kef-type K+ transport system membrane component KefB|nr:cation:proton antiporter [Bacilli bacterium]